MGFHHGDILYLHDFTKNKLCHRCLDNNLQKIFSTNILEDGTGQILLIAVLMAHLRLKLQMEIAG